jgi:hypothetical protein
MASEDEQTDHEPARQEGGGGGGGLGLLWLLPFAATIAAMMFGIVIGGAAVWIVKPTRQPVEYLKTASLAELQLVCEPVVQEQETQLAKVKDEIVALKAQVAEKEAEVVQLRSAATKQGKRAISSDGRNYAGEPDKAREELAEARLQLTMMEEVKDQLVEQLTRTQERLAVVEGELTEQVAIAEVLRDENGKLKDDVIVQQWFRFVTDAQLDVCESGSRKKTEDCRASVIGEISKIKREFVHCVRSEQATPMAKHLEKGASAPSFARMMDQDNKHLEGWYLQMCDPTLPEATIPEPVTTPEETAPVEAIEPDELDGTSGL